MIETLRSIYRRTWRPALVAGALLFIWVFRAPLAEFWALFSDQQAIMARVAELGWIGPFFLAALLLAQVFVAIIPGHALIMAGGYLYGPYLSIALTTLTTVIGGQIAFIIARRYGRPLINRLAKPEAVEKWDRLARHQGPLFFFFTMVLPFFPSDLMCYVAGLGTITSRVFLVVNIVSRLLTAIAMTLIGSFGFRPPWQFWALFIGCLAILYTGWAVSQGKIKVRRPRLALPTKYQIARAIVLGLIGTYRRMFGIRYRTRGLDQLPPGAKILTPNHVSTSESYLLGALIEGRVVALAKGAILTAPVTGWLLSATGQIPVWPGKGRQAFDQAAEALRRGDTVLLFPEGRLNPGRDPQRICTGAVRLSLRTGAPIIPIGLHVSPGDLRQTRMGGIQMRGDFRLQVGQPWQPQLDPGNPEVNAHSLSQALITRIYALADQAAGREV